MGMDQLLDDFLPIKYQGVVRRNFCPKCGSQSNIRETQRGLYCIYCGWSESGGQHPKFIPRIPDSPAT